MILLRRFEMVCFKSVLDAYIWNLKTVFDRTYLQGRNRRDTDVGVDLCTYWGKEERTNWG